MQLMGRPVRLSWALHRQPQSWERGTLSAFAGPGSSAPNFGGSGSGDSAGPQPRYDRLQQLSGYGEGGSSPSLAMLPVVAATPGNLSAFGVACDAITASG